MGTLISVFRRYVLGTVIILPDFKIAFFCNVFVSLLAKVTMKLAMIHDAVINITRLL